MCRQIGDMSSIWRYVANFATLTFVSVIPILLPILLVATILLVTTILLATTILLITTIFVVKQNCCYVHMYISNIFKKKRHYPNSLKSEHCWPAIGPKVDNKIGSFNPHSIYNLTSKQKWTNNWQYLSVLKLFTYCL